MWEFVGCILCFGFLYVLCVSCHNYGKYLRSLPRPDSGTGMLDGFPPFDEYCEFREDVPRWVAEAEFHAMLFPELWE